MMARTAKRHDLGFGRLRVAAPCVLFLALCLRMAQGQAPTEVHIGGLYAVAFTNVRERASHFRLALDMINDKTDGWFDDFLPNTQIKYVVDNSGCSSGVALEGAAKQGTPCMQGSSRTPVVATVGATCSGASMSAQDLLKLYKIPMVSYSATSPDLSDKTLYPYFLRTVPSDLAQGKGIATLAKHLGVKRMGLIASDGPYGIGLADQFRAQASQDSIDNPSSAYKTVTKYAEVTVDGKKEAKVDLTMICKVRDLHKEGVKHVFGALQTPDAFFFAVTIYLSGYLKGNDYMFYAPDSWSNDNFNTILDGDITSWFYNPAPNTIGGYWSSSAVSKWSADVGDIIPIYQSGATLESVSVATNCLKITGTVSGDTVTLTGYGTGALSNNNSTITWDSGEVWSKMTPPTNTQVETTMQGSLGLTPSTFGPLLQNYLDTVWEPKNTRYTFDSVNQNIANEFFTDNGEELGWTDGDGDRTTVHPYGPPSFDAAVAVATAIHNVIEAGESPSDGEKLLAALKTVELNGLSGKVSFDENGDRSGSRYTVLNRVSGDFTIGLLERSDLSFDKSITFPGSKSTAPGDGTCFTDATITQYCSGRGTCNFGEGTCVCPVGYGGANCEVAMPPPCTHADFDFVVSKCNVENDRMGVYSFKNGSQSCCNSDNFGALCPTGLLLPPPIIVECDYVKETSAVAQAFIALAAVSIAFQAGLLIMIILHRRNPFMRRSQPVMMGLSVAGSIMGIATIFVLVGERDTALCRSVPSLLTLGFTLMYASLALKMYRIHILFNNKMMKVVTVGVRQIMAILGCILAAEILCLMLFIFVDDLKAGVVYEAMRGALIPYFECQSSASSPLGIVLIFMKILLLFYGLVLGFRVRNAPADYQEVKVIVMGVYNTALAVIVVMPMYFYLELDRDVQFILVSCGILYCFNGATAMVVIPKILHILRGDQAEDAQKLIQTHMTHKTKQGQTTGSGLNTVHTTSDPGSPAGPHPDTLALLDKEREIADLKKKLEEALKAIQGPPPPQEEKKAEAEAELEE